MRGFFNRETRELVASAFGRKLPWLGVALLGSVLVLNLLLMGGGTYLFGPREQLDLRRPAVQATSNLSVDELSRCFLKDWGNRLSLQRVGNPSPPSALRLYNPVRHITVDVEDRGRDRLIRAYARQDRGLSADERAAIVDCSISLNRAFQAVSRRLPGR